MRQEDEAAIVTTLRDASAVLNSFIAHHKTTGFKHLYLYFDDPADPAIARVNGDPSVTAIPHDGALRAAWRGLGQYAAQGPFIEREVMARQVLNTAHAMTLSRAAGHDWLLHIDSDELFHTEKGDASAHFASLQGAPIDTINYPNYEALPESEDIGDFFREVTLFKVPPELNRKPVTAEGVRMLQTCPQLHPDFFHYYGAGKSAVRLSVQGMEPNGVHAFTREGGFSGARSMEGAILHYAVCGFEAFWTKYRTLGAFADSWWGKYEIEASIGRFHLDARNAVAKGREDARAFYREHAMMNDSARIEALIAHGFLQRIRGLKT